MIKIHSLSAQKLFLFVGIIFSLLFFTVSAQAQITASGCGTATVSPYAGTSSIFQIDANFEATYYCGEGFGIYENGSLLNCNNSLANTSSLSCQGHTGTFAYANGGTAESRTFYLDTRKQPYVFSDVPPTDNSLDIIQSPQNLVAPGASVTFTAAPVMLDGSAAPTVFTWFRNGAEIGGETGATLSEIPPHNGTTYSVQAGTLQSAEKTVLFTTAADGRFTTSGATATIVALDGCNSIYKLDGELGSDYNTTFQILENGTPLTNADLDVSSGGLGLSWNGTNIVSNSHGTNRKFSWYLNTRNGKPYQLLSTMPTRAFVSIALQGSSTIPKGNAVDFTSNVCPETGKTITGYQWIKNENGTESNLGVGATLTDTPTKNGTIYYLRVTFSDGTTKDSERIKILFAESFDGRFSMSNATATIFALDDCNSIYELHVTLGREHHSEFQILENGTPLTSADINVAGVGLTINGTTITSSSHGTNLQFTWYINTRNGKPYELLSTEPFNDPTWLSVKLSADKNIINAAGEAVQLTVEVCPPDDGTYTYEWYENGVLMHGKSGDAITVNPTKNGTDYTVVVNGTSSNEEIILFADACDNRLTIQEWYQTTIISDACAIDECHAVYRLTLNMKNDAHFAILLDGAAIDAQILDISGLSQEADGSGKPGFRRTGGDAVITCFLDMRNNAFNTLSIARPARDVPFVLATITGGSAIARCTPIEITSCPNEPTFTYQWYKNGVAMPGETNATLTDDVSGENAAGYTYYVVVNEGAAGEIISNTITISYQPDPKLPGTMTLTGYSEQLNWYEHNVKTGDNILFTVSPADPTIDSYVLQYKSLAVGSTWRDTTITPTIGTDVVFSLTPEFGAKYRIKGLAQLNATCNREFYSDSSLVRFIYDCTGGDTWDLFSEKFGQLSSATEWQENSGVVGHTFAGNSCNTECWCSNRRIADGFYAITANPKTSDCLTNAEFNACAAPYTCGNGDYWYGTDHTGNTNGGMLFVNVGADAVNQVVYEQEITVDGGCKDVKVLFSAFISNATIKGQTPVDVRLDIWNADKTKILYSISSGEVITRSQADVTAGKAWANLSFKFDAEEGASYWLQLTNNAPSGSGNDILIDDISVIICVPKIELELLNPEIIDFGNAVDIGVCEDNVTVKLEAHLPTGSGVITDLFPTPIYQFQYSRDNGVTWNNFSTAGNSIDIDLVHADDIFRGHTQWRIIVAGSQATIDGVGNGTVTEPSCNNMYLASNILTVDFDHRVYDDIVLDECFGQSTTFEAEIPTNGTWKWYNADDQGNPIGAPIRQGSWSAAQPTVTITVTAPTNTTPAYYVFRPISPYDCEFDYSVTITGRDCDDIVLEKSASKAVIDAGETIQYTIVIENKSQFPSKNIVINDKLPATMSYRSHVINPVTAGTYSTTTGDWNIARLEVGASATLTITVQNIGGADSDIINYAFVKTRTKEAQEDETVSYPDYNAAWQDRPAFADTAKIYVNPQEAPGILGNQPCKNDVVSYSLNTSLIPLTPRAKYKWSILPPQGTNIQGSTSAATFEVKYYNAPAEYVIQCEITPDSTVFDPPIIQTKEVYVTDVPNVLISGEMHVCYGDIETYTVLNDNTPNATYSWALLSGENELIIDGAQSKTATVEWLPRNGAFATDALQVEAVNTSQWAICTNSGVLAVSIHPNPPVKFSHDGSSTMYFQSEPSYRHTDSIYTDIPVNFINESHTVASVVNVEYYWDFAGDGTFTQTSYDGLHTYHDVGDYTVQLLAVDTVWGCKTLIDTPLVVLPNPNCIASFPNAFTPTKTSNNVFGALYTNGVMLEGFELRVFNRWGTMVWSTNDPYEYWDGTFRGEMGKQDVYVYHCKAMCQDIDPKTQQRKTLSIKGDVTLIR